MPSPPSPQPITRPLLPSRWWLWVLSPTSTCPGEVGADGWVGYTVTALKYLPLPRPVRCCWSLLDIPSYNDIFKMKVVRACVTL